MMDGGEALPKTSKQSSLSCIFMPLLELFDDMLNSTLDESTQLEVLLVWLKIYLAGHTVSEDVFEEILDQWQIPTKIDQLVMILIDLIVG